MILKIVMRIVFVFILFAAIDVFGKAEYVPAPTDLFRYNQFNGYETINDWVKIGSPGYEQYMVLPSLTDTVPDTVASGYRTMECQLFVAPVATQVIPAGTWAGYEWTVPAEYDKVIIKWFCNGWDGWDPANVQMRLTDGEENVLWTWNTQGWVTMAEPLVLPIKTRTIRFIVYQVNTHNEFATSNASVYFMNMYAATPIPECGDDNHPIPVGDLDKNCVVDMGDVALLAGVWLEENDPQIP